ncbi:3-methyl-2-oxobutanoate hydroxymethyltransferase [Bacillus sp. H-16]|uniref:3-methyl-2-oxobutanoate hydroxymethyltransferase n=1 Tax=Alteribacter salitolerans TaxID=2912333 RepID=UPI0019647030|nr:3-methyl-2-oxobutanoate hydroxymethyltransferase [Alteribacter salitolerans]MBM7094622.1 3-methyl-2-oxobutanoate hydroxymethyltransferase [Alteribacter salitolerans]
MKNSALFKQMKQEGEKISMITAYDAPGGRHAQDAGMDVILVGDSAGMVVHGYNSTIPVTVDDIVLHTKAVKRGAPDTFTVADMPFLSYHGSIDKTVQNAGRLMQEAGAEAVKVEGRGTVLDVTKTLTEAGVPVVAHLGLTPQTVGVLGGYKVQGKDAESAAELIDDAKKAQEAGAIMLVLECVPHQVAQMVTKSLTIPVIGIGAGRHTDGQVLVWHDLLGFTESRVPKFVKQYVKLSGPIQKALKEYNRDVKTGRFPEEEHTFSMDETEIKELYGNGGLKI